MRILFPTGSFYPAQTGGPDNTIYWITKALTQVGHQAVISTTDRGVAANVLRNKWLNTPYGEVIYSHDRIHYFPLCVVYNSLRKLKSADLVHLAMVTYPASWLIAILNSFFYGKPMIWSTHGDLDPPMLLRSRKKKALVIWLINKLVRKNLLTFHSTCNAETKYIRKNFGEEVRITQILNYMELPEPLDRESQRYLLYVGRIDPKKAIENLIAALAATPSFLGSDFVLKVVGDYDNAYGHRLIEQARAAKVDHKIEFLGHREGAEKEELLARAWFIIMPSHTENFGIVVMEALAQRTPAVASTGTPWEILPLRDAGFWTDNDLESLSAVVDKIIKLTPARMREMETNALELVRDEFSIKNNIGKWERAYETAAAL